MNGTLEQPIIKEEPGIVEIEEDVVMESIQVPDVLKFEDSPQSPPISPTKDQSPLKRRYECIDDNDVLRSRGNDPSWDEERRHYQKIVATFREYGSHTSDKLTRSLKHLKSLSTSHRLLLADYKTHLESIRKCIDHNQNIFVRIVMEQSRLFKNQEDVYPTKTMKKYGIEPVQTDFDKLQAVLKQIVRDWSVDGAKERELVYQPIIDEVERLYSSTKDQEQLSEVKILVPGAGLGRLAHDLVRKGYAVEGNEFSLFMLFASNFILNKCDEPEQYKCYPWIHQTTNVLNQFDQTRPVVFPDIDPFDLPENSKFSMTAGDFLEVYGTPSQKNAWDCVTTCFFIDCAHNIIEFVERIHYCLKPGGIWINLGPLLYHYAEMSDEQSIEPPFNILIEIIRKTGFNIQKQLTNMPTTYADNEKSMLSYTYNSVYLVCEKI